MNPSCDTIRVPPHHIESEVSVIGSVLIDPPSLGKATEIIQTADFYRPAHQTIWDGILTMAGKGDACDLVTMPAYFKAKGELESIGGIEYLVKCVEGVPSSANIEYYARIVRDHSLRRQLVIAGTKLAQGAFAESSDPDALMCEIQQSILELSQRNSSAQHLVSAGDAMEEALEWADKVAKGEIPPGLTCGFSALDEPIGGFQPGDLIVLAARPSVGKSALAMAFAIHAQAQGKPVMIVSGEMGRRSLSLRVMASMSSVSTAAIKAGQYGEYEWEAREGVRELVRDWKMDYYDRAATAEEISIRARQVQAKRKSSLGLIVVDYLQIMKTDAALNSADRYGNFAWSMKCLAMDLACPVLLLSQLNRGQDGDKQPPGLTRLRGSGNIEEHANTVVILHVPPEPAYTPAGKLIVWAKVAKARDGAVTPWQDRNGEPAIKLGLTGHLTRFEEITLGEGA